MKEQYEKNSDIEMQNTETRLSAKRMSSGRRSMALTEGKPMQVILVFAVPLLIGQLFQLFYGLVDTRIVGEILGETSLAAVGATSPLSDLLIGMMNGFTNGLAIIIATFYGARDEKHMRRALGGTILLGMGGALAVSALSITGLPVIMKFLNVDQEILGQAKQYITVILLGLVCATAYNVCAAILRAIGDSFTPLLFLILASFLNIGLDYLFIGGIGLGVMGAALATVIAQTISAVLCFFYMRWRYPFLKLEKGDFVRDGEVYHKLLASGCSMAFMISFVQLGTLALQTSINHFGTKTIVAHTAARKATGVFMLPFSILGTSLATFCGQNLGANKPERIREGILKAVLVAWVWSLGVMAVTYLAAPSIISLITASKDPEVLATASGYLRFDTLFYFVPAVISIFRNSMQGFGDTRTPVFSSALELIGKVAVVLFLTPRIAYRGIIVAEPIVWVIMVIPLIVNMFRNPAMKNSR